MKTHDHITLSTPESPARIGVSRTSGLPESIELVTGDRTIAASLSAHLSLVVGGAEVRNPVGGIEYHGTERVDVVQAVPAEIRTVHLGTCVDFEVPFQTGGLDLTVTYRLHPTSPYFEIFMEIASITQSVVIRDLEISIDLRIPRARNLQLNIPGNHLRRDLPLDSLGSTALRVSPVGGLEGSSGIVSLSDGKMSAVVWPNSMSEILNVRVSRRAADSANVAIGNAFAGEIGGLKTARVSLGALDLLEGGFDSLRGTWHRYATRYGLTSPPGKPKWVPGASIFEAQIGSAPFRGGHENAPYGSIAELTRDLPRISSLGFSVIQLMPKQPYPSYNVHDYWDIDTSYGDTKELKTLVAELHTRGMKIILDILMHGVIDNESINETIRGVEEGPLANRLDEPVRDIFVDPNRDSYQIAWSRHILDFGPHWRSGSPPRNALEEVHPDWFYRDSSGHVTGIYTKAFDVRNPEMRAYFTQAILFLMEELGIDGFRFDAPTYNDFPNWASWSRHRASASALGCVGLFEDLRQRMKERDPEALLYTEPSGHLLRRSMDLNYNYDESWLITALGGVASGPGEWVRNAREFMQWHEDRDAFLPRGSATAHHIDSHDSFWWPDWGHKWRREQLPIEKVQALTAAYLGLDGAYMMFVGGEAGIEEVLTVLNGVRRSSPGYWRHPGRFVYSQRSSPDLFWIRRTDSARTLEVIVNLTGAETIQLATDELPKAFATRYSTRAARIDNAIRIEPNGIVVVEG